MNRQVVTNVADIFEQGNLHMSTKLRHFGGQGQQVVKYIMAKLRKYKGVFFESNLTIADNVGCSVRTVQNTIKRCEHLDIFIVSSRKESTFNGKMRQTTNKIQLLSYQVVEVVKEVVETVRKVAVKVKEVVSHASEKVSEVMKKVTPRKPYSKKSIRTEIVPEWLGQEQTIVKATLEEQEEMRKLLEGFNKRRDNK